MLGFGVAAMSFTGLISAPVFGRISDYLGKSKATLIIADLFAIGGTCCGFLLFNR